MDRLFCRLNWKSGVESRSEISKPSFDKKPIETTLRAVLSVAMASMLGFALAACGQIGASETTELNRQAPVALTPNRDTSTTASGALTAPVKDVELRKAVERYRLTKQRAAGAIDFAGADLNGDGNPEAIVLFSGEDWCVKTGCSLVVFQEEPTGYRPVSHVTRVRSPVLIGPESAFGWRDLMVQTGGGPAPIRTVRLGFTGKGYPVNALLQPEPVQEMLARSQQVLAANSPYGSPTNTLSAQSSAR